MRRHLRRDSVNHNAPLGVLELAAQSSQVITHMLSLLLRTSWNFCWKGPPKIGSKSTWMLVLIWKVFLGVVVLKGTNMKSRLSGLQASMVKWTP
ncbi:hypothetical protein Nepgr_012184 [Nepenthes gracilis]|uniref:Uncharacterized protein n=1 Tax=Nepenthes gracilis TaxID=150966 RepID=A0AAD3SFL5_NEPGR|nr:hypothetical protein Nepgr_012184 [Nepenthes gracilis]